MHLQSRGRAWKTTLGRHPIELRDVWVSQPPAGPAHGHARAARGRGHRPALLSVPRPGLLDLRGRVLPHGALLCCLRSCRRSRDAAAMVLTLWLVSQLVSAVLLSAVSLLVCGSVFRRAWWKITRTGPLKITRPLHSGRRVCVCVRTHTRLEQRGVESVCVRVRVCARVCMSMCVCLRVGAGPRLCGPRAGGS